MKTKIFKVLSSMLALAVILSTCICAMGAVSAAETNTYYVGTSEDASITTYATVAEAIQAAIEANIAETETVTIKVLSDVETGTYPSYTFDLVIDGSDVIDPESPDSTKPNITFPDNGELANNGVNTTTYRNVVFVVTGNGFPTLEANNSYVIIEKSVGFNAGYLTICYGNWQNPAGDVTMTSQTLELGNAPVYVNLSNTGVGGRDTDLVSLVLDCPDSYPTRIQFNGIYGGTTTYGDVFINIKDAEGLSAFELLNGAVFEKNIYFINSASEKFDITAVEGFGSLPITKVFILKNLTGNKEIVTYTGNSDGEFRADVTAIDTEDYKFVVYDEDGYVYDTQIDEDGCFVIEEAGVYSLVVECIGHEYDYDCDKDCNHCGELRDVDHQFTDEADADCDYGCGFIRDVGPTLREEGGVMYYYENGVKSTATAIVEYEGKQIYINKGRFLGKTGIVTVNSKKVYVRNGEFLGASGIVTIGGKKMYIRNGYFLGASGIVTVGGKKMYIRNGYFLGKTGIVTVDGKKLYIRNGYFLGASGTVKVNGKTYKVVKGIVK